MHPLEQTIEISFHRPRVVERRRSSLDNSSLAGSSFSSPTDTAAWAAHLLFPEEDSQDYAQPKTPRRLSLGTKLVDTPTTFLAGAALPRTYSNGVSSLASASSASWAHQQQQKKKKRLRGGETASTPDEWLQQERDCLDSDRHDSHHGPSRTTSLNSRTTSTTATQQQQQQQQQQRSWHSKQTLNTASRCSDDDESTVQHDEAADEESLEEGSLDDFSDDDDDDDCDSFCDASAEEQANRSYLRADLGASVMWSDESTTDILDVFQDSWKTDQHTSTEPSSSLESSSNANLPTSFPASTTPQASSSTTMTTTTPATGGRPKLRSLRASRQGLP